MDQQTPWEKASSAEGATDSERALSRLAKKAFLSLWSYTNVFTDEGRSSGKGDGKELCDLLVVFGNDVLLFSDKHCEYHTNADVKIAWPRWYKRAIEKSAKQLAGAEKFARKFPERIFLDKGCQTPLPVPLPTGPEVRYFLIAVTRGAHKAAQQLFGGNRSGSVILRNDIRGKEHLDTPFQIGFPLDSGRFVHVLDEVTVDLILEELDTVPDLVAYLTCKENFLLRSDVLITVPGEEEILARYMTTIREEQHALPEIPEEARYFTLPEGDWAAYEKSLQRAAKREADKISYLWDSLIEHHSNFIRAGTAISLLDYSSEQVDHERVVRAMAQQNRLARRRCGSDLHYVLSRDDPLGAFTRIYIEGFPSTRVFVFLAAKRQEGMSQDQYRQSRMESLTTYCHAIKGDISSVQEAIGIAAEPFVEKESSFDFLYVDHSVSMSDIERKAWRDMADELGILRPKTQVSLHANGEQEFPIPFNTPPMNRAERRQAERQARRNEKKSVRGKETRS